MCASTCRGHRDRGRVGCGGKSPHLGVSLENVHSCTFVAAHEERHHSRCFVSGSPRSARAAPCTSESHFAMGVVACRLGGTSATLACLCGTNFGGCRVHGVPSSVELPHLVTAPHHRRMMTAVRTVMSQRRCHRAALVVKVGTAWCWVERKVMAAAGKAARLRWPPALLPTRASARM